MLSEGSQNVQRGQVQQFEYEMGDDVSLQFNSQYLYIRDPSGQERLRFELDGGLLKYQVFENGDWGQQQTMTDPGTIIPEDSQTLPHNPAITRLDMSGNQLRVYLQNVLYMAISTLSTMIKTKELQIDNGSYDFIVKLSTALGQKLILCNDLTGQPLVTFSEDGMNASGKPIKGVQASTDPNSAVTLQQLQDVNPQSLQARAPSNIASIKNVQGNVIIQFSNNDIISTKPLRYAPRPATFQSDMLPDVQQVQSMLSMYQLTVGRDQVNGYAGLNDDRRVALFTIPNEVARINQGQLRTGDGSNITTTSIDEGDKLFYSDQRVSQVIADVKGVASGLCPLNANGKIGQQYIDSIPIGAVFTGADAQKTSQLNPAYQTSQPGQGDRYIASDSGIVYILKQIPFTSPSNWVQLSQGGVSSVNGQEGIVALDSDSINEGLINKYFAQGLQDYKAASVNQPDELVMLDSAGHLDGAVFGNQLQLEGGYARLSDNQVSELAIEEAKTATRLLTIGQTGITSGKKITYGQTPIIANTLDLPHKGYVDDAVVTHIPSKLMTSQTQIQTASSSIDVIVNGSAIQTLLDNSVTSQVPIKYGSVVQVDDPKQLASKEYVDDLLQSFIVKTGAAKQFLQATSNLPITSSGRITNWNVQLQSSASDRVCFNTGDSTFTLQANTYRIYLGAQIKEYADQGLVQIQISLRDVNSLENYFYYSFESDFSSEGGNQAQSISLPYIWKFNSEVTVEVFVQCLDVNYGVYNAYLMIEEFANFDVSVGLDRITDGGLTSRVQAQQNQVAIDIGGSTVLQVDSQSLTMQPDKTIKYDSVTSIQDPLTLVTKGYVDEQINVSTISINNVGQMLQVGMSNNQLVQVGQTVQFNSVQINTSQTMAASGGLLTFVQGFVYRVKYKIGCRFSNPGTIQLAMRDTATLTNVSGSIIYITYESQDSSGSQAEFYLDLRGAATPIEYQIVILSQTNVIQIYKTFSLFTAEQVQIISDLYFDRIEQSGQTSQLRLQNDKLVTTLDNQVLLRTANNSGNVQQELQIDNKDIITVSTATATSISNVTSLQNATVNTQRSSTLTAAVSNQNSIDISASISNANVKSASISATQASTLQLGTQTPSIQLTNTTTTAYKPILYDPIVAVTNPQQLATKAYVDTIAVAPITNNIQNTANPTSRLTADQLQLTNGTTPLYMNLQKITGLALPSDGGDAVNKQYADSLVSNISSAEIKNTNNANSKLVAALNELTNGQTPLNMNQQKIANLAAATVGTDALNRDIADSRYYLSTVTLDGIAAPTANVSLNSHKITNLAAATTATDALSQQAGDNRYYQQTITLDSIALPTANLSLNSQKITDLANATTGSDALNRDTGDNRYYTQTTPLSSMTAPTTDLSMNSQKITNLATPTLSSDAVTKSYVDTINQGMAYMVFSISVGDLATPVESYTSTNNFITNVAFAQGTTGGRAFYTVSVDSTKVFGGDDYYIMYSIRSQRGSLSDTDNDMMPVVTMMYQKTSFVIYLEESVSGTQDIAIDGVLFRKNNIQGTLPINALTQEQGDARYYANNRYYAFKLLLGDVPFTSGSTNTIYSLTLNGTNVPVNQSNVITAVDWVRQTGRTDTVRLRLSLSNTIINGRTYQVLLTPETTFANASGGPAAEWQFGGEQENYVLQTFGINNSSTPKFFIHARDITASASQSLLVNGMIVITEPVNTIAPITNQLPYYTFSIEIGDVPSGQENYYSTNNIITNIIYNNMGSTDGRWAVYIDSANVFGGADYYVMLQVRSIRGFTTTSDNDLNVPIVSEYYKSYFVIYLEEIGAPVQNIALDGIIVRRP